MQTFKQTLTEALQNDYPNINWAFLDDQEFNWEPNIEENLQPNGPTLCIYLNEELISLEGTLETIEPGYQKVFENPDLQFTFNQQVILITIDL